MQAGKTIAAKRERVTSDSERERVRGRIRKRKLLSIVVALALGGFMVYLGVRAFQEWLTWSKKREEVIIIEPEPSVEVIDEKTGKIAENVSSRVKEFVVELEEEFVLVGHKISKVRIPADKIREIDLEVEGFKGIIKVSIDRNPAVLAEDAERMIRYLAGQGIDSVEYVDVRIERKAYWK